ncbi:MAG: hypothetical protein RSG52_12115, partial [Terrisporobacter sp.]|uniref:hypothetical protein n=1 Tax=Terrisporobacter sp. TaxID=1965305 RepID=UPI002FC8B69B
MNKKEVDGLRKLNNELEKSMSKKSDKVYTDMVVYLRVSNLTQLQQEQVRRDLIGMIIDGEKRDQSIDEIIGTDYKDVCDEIIVVFPVRTLKDRILEVISTYSLCISILFIIFTVGEFIGNFIKGSDLWRVNFEMYQLILMPAIIIIANIIVKSICEDPFKKENKEVGKKGKVIGFIKLWSILFIVFGLAFLFTVKFKA